MMIDTHVIERSEESPVCSVVFDVKYAPITSCAETSSECGFAACVSETELTTTVTASHQASDSVDRLRFIVIEKGLTDKNARAARLS